MQSHLTRRVFRAIINNEPLRYSQCHRTRLLHTITPARVRTAIPGLPYTSRRNIFVFTSDPERTPTTLPSEKGLKPMADLMRALKDRSRTPPADILAKAFQTFFTMRLENPMLISHFQARALIVTFKHLRSQQDEMEESDWQNVFSTENLEKVLDVLSESECAPQAREVVMNLARYAYQELNLDHGFGPGKISRPALSLYINILAMNGNPEDARHTLLKFWGQMSKVTPSPWLTILKGFAMKNDLRQVRKIVDEWGNHGNKFDQASHEELVKFLIDHNQLKAAQTVYDYPIADGSQPSMAASEALIKHYLLNSRLESAEGIFNSLPDEPNEETASIILLMAAAKGSNASALAQKVDSWTAKNPQIKEAITIDIVNDLLQYANALQNPQLASDFMTLADQWGLIPDSQTYILQLESRIQAGDVEQTLKVLEEDVDATSLTSDNLPVANKLIAMLCRSEEKDALFNQISSLLDPLFQDNVHLESATIAALTHMLLYRHDLEAVSELLRPRLGSYSDEEKIPIRDALAEFITDKTQSDTDAWNAYELLKIAFPETPVSIRTKIMTSFFNRHRSDLAVLVFGHMRQADEPSRRPRQDTYARCFQGLARTADATNLELVHNMLKLDLEVDLNTRIQNGLMMAYAACEMPEKSMEIFRQILQSEEGPCHKTITIFFKACQKHHNGAQEAIKMMSKVKKLEITMNRPLYSAYMEALAAQCEFDLAVEAIRNMEAETGMAPTSNTIGLFYNAIPYQYWKDEVEKWASQTYPEHWDHLMKMKRVEREEGLEFEGISNDVSV
ncbi:Tetratricopeptide-like helical [Penicillium bovifimosum]|uniref:Tetratricopeptide-like helical n=1 Tax=Penicillium bovifimosum TaxID=126998 RepID=A0A9W9H599_9EURO|nr:Tetratricopeptide-like helical [Penicillium bovifimosum]KAJ5138917.1 Tetratricopeptide-like helical [Penicillium bovifimosum]